MSVYGNFAKNAAESADDCCSDDCCGGNEATTKNQLYELQQLDGLPGTRRCWRRRAAATPRR